jgi:hypothetical protein
VVRAADLVRKYKADPSSADILFTGRLVRVRLTAFNVAGCEVHWWAAYAEGDPPAAVFRFADPPALKAPAYVEGRCTGLAGPSVVITDCRVVRPTPQAAP